MRDILFSCCLTVCICIACSFPRPLSGEFNNISVIPVDSGWANNSVNTAVFRKNSLTSLRDTQYVAFYDPDGFVVLGKRTINESKWQLHRTNYRGNISDAHNTISIMVDGHGYLHMVWDQHNSRLRYARSITPGSLDLGSEIPMTSQREERVTYPEFYRLPDGSLVFFYRDGSSGNGNLVINRYNLQTKQWSTLQSNLISGEGKRNAYWQACVDGKGTIHISWVWRETPDVASNHDLCYARSRDGGITWERSDGEKYDLPITAANAEIACYIPQGSQLINQTAMCADASGAPFIASYWCDPGATVPQYRLVYRTGQSWRVQDLGFRKTPFSLSGMGTKRIPISRPQIIVWPSGNQSAAAIIFRDSERNNRVSVAVCDNLQQSKWMIKDLSDQDVGSWEPTYDTELWAAKGQLHLFVQRTEQADAEGKANIPPQIVQVLQWQNK